jgi:hypothetical protein
MHGKPAAAAPHQASVTLLNAVVCKQGQLQAWENILYM